MKKKLFLLWMLVVSVLSYADDKKAKYVFLFIGDGMGLSEVNATEAYLAAKQGKIGVEKLNFTQFPVLGLATTYAQNRYITDSAAAGTALATGNKTSVETIGMDAARKQPFKSIAEMAKAKGMKVGIISTANMNDATPAAFYAHQPERKMYNEITQELVKSGFDFFGGGGLKKVDAKDELKKCGYKIVNTKKALYGLKKGVKKIYAICPTLDDDKGCNYEIDKKKDDVSLADLTKKAIELLDYPEGFFIMIEGGKIDWANHSNDAATAINDVVAFNDAVKVAMDFYEKHKDDTLIVVTSDHETGGFAQGVKDLGYNTDYKKLVLQKVSYDAVDNKISKYSGSFQDIKPYLKDNFGFWDTEGFSITSIEEKSLEDAFIKSKNSAVDAKDASVFSGILTRLLDSKVGIGWTTNAHTGMPVGVFAKGVGDTVFGGYIDNTDVGKNIMKIMGF